MECNLPILKWGLNDICWVNIGSQRLCSSMLGILCIEDDSLSIKLNDVRKDCIYLFNRTGF